uniref:Uncharacterized protein n=1 Tax=Amphimedon queenslandica TaxID=400682 RepID=A0A1X7VTP8_AMPQE
MKLILFSSHFVGSLGSINKYMSRNKQATCSIRYKNLTFPLSPCI